MTAEIEALRIYNNITLSTNIICKDIILSFSIIIEMLNLKTRKKYSGINHFCRKYFAYVDIMEEHLARRYNAQD